VDSLLLRLLRLVGSIVWRFVASCGLAPPTFTLLLPNPGGALDGRVAVELRPVVGGDRLHPGAVGREPSDSFLRLSRTNQYTQATGGPHSTSGGPRGRIAP
jgi:hypothetical protein